jgi:predicted transcriptional regulator
MEKYIGFKLEAELLKQLKDFATSTQRSVSGVIRLAVIDFLERQKG